MKEGQSKDKPLLGYHTYFKHDDCVTLTFHPPKNVVIDGCKSVYVDSAGRLNITIGVKRSARERKRIDQRNAKLREQIIEAMRVKGKQ
jgi:hypothetical protein